LKCYRVEEVIGPKQNRRIRRRRGRRRRKEVTRVTFKTGLFSVGCFKCSPNVFEGINCAKRINRELVHNKNS
jgi:hypothetical protein